MDAVIITGASSGIGEQLAREFHNQGWFVHMVARRKDRLDLLQTELKNSKAWPCDLTQVEQISNFRDSMEESCSNLKALVNNAGVFSPQSLDDDEDETWQYHFECNLMSAVRLTRSFWKVLKKNQSAILNISSTLGVRPIANTAAYSALKSAMNNWTQSLALEGAPHGLRANAICPGIIDTPIHSYYQSDRPEDQQTYSAVQKAQPLGRTGRPADIAPMAVELCSQHSSWLTGNIISIDGGILLNS